MKLLATDYDNTLELHGTNNTSILKRNIIALNKFIQKNIVLIATGRHFYAIYKTFTLNNIKFDYLCSNNGAELYDSNYNLLSVIPLDINDLKILNNIKEKKYYRNPCNSNLITSVNFYIDDLNKYEEIKKILNKKLTNSFIEYKYPKIKIINKKCDKVYMIDIVKKINHIKDKDVYTIGDDINDIKMISKYNGYTLKSANEKVKKVSSKIYNELNNLIKDISVS